MTAKQTFRKSLMLLDRGLIDRGVESLRESINLAEKENDIVTLGGSLCALGDFLYQKGHNEDAKKVLHRLLSLENDDDLLDYEFNRAEEILGEMNEN